MIRPSILVLLLTFVASHASAGRALPEDAARALAGCWRLESGERWTIRRERFRRWVLERRIVDREAYERVHPGHRIVSEGTRAGGSVYRPNVPVRSTEALYWIGEAPVVYRWYLSRHRGLLRLSREGEELLIVPYYEPTRGAWSRTGNVQRARRCQAG